MSAEQMSLPSKEIYGGFWIRLGAFCIDMLIALPLVGLHLWMDGLSKTTYCVITALNVVASVFVSIYCVKKWGGSPGKLALGLKIVLENGDDVDWAGVFWRVSIIYVHYFVSTAVTLLSVGQIADDVFASFNHTERTHAISAVYPKLSLQLLILGNLWILESFVLLMNEKRRALHDFMAGTVVIKRKYQAVLKNGEQPVMTGASEM
jgi:uncharacterized RDD family membrane protein YckC